MWPDLAKFCNFDKILKDFCNLLRAYFVLGTIWAHLGKKLCDLAKFHCCKWPKLKRQSSDLVTLPPTTFAAVLHNIFCQKCGFQRWEFSITYCPLRKFLKPLFSKSLKSLKYFLEIIRELWPIVCYYSKYIEHKVERVGVRYSCLHAVARFHHFHPSTSFFSREF